MPGEHLVSSQLMNPGPFQGHHYFQEQIMPL